MVIETCRGLADDLISGRTSGVRIPIRDGRPPSAPDPLSTSQVLQLAEMGAASSGLRDVRKTSNGRSRTAASISCRRPITRLCFGGIEGEWTNADFRDGGVASDVVTPLMWSLYEFIWDRAINGFLKDLRLSAGDFPAARVFYGRPYWNLAAVKQCAGSCRGSSRASSIATSAPGPGTPGTTSVPPRTSGTSSGRCRSWSLPPGR